MNKIKSYKVSTYRTYDPEAYIEYCKENNCEPPTQDGFLKYIQDWIDDDFGNNLTNIEMIK